MMDNKLSELSKPVAYSLRFRNMNGEPDKTINTNTTFSTLEKAKAYGLGTRYVTQDDGKIVNVRDPSQDPVVEPLYSQEYVSALTQRIADLEAIRSDASQVFKEIGSELGCNPENESIMVAIDYLKATQMTGTLKDVLKRNIELEAKLATPVRLPERYSIDCGVCADPNGDWLNLPDVIATLLTAGFTVEGDE